MNQPTPPPWTLTGRAFVLMFNFPEKFVKAEKLLPAPFQRRFARGIGMIALVDYATSPVGPYRELAVSPGLVYDEGKKLHTVSRIYVDSEASMVSGRANWGLPKELAEFDWRDEYDGQLSRVSVSKDGAQMLSIAFRPGKLALPLPGWLVRLKLFQIWEDQAYRTPFRVKGRVRMAQPGEVVIDTTRFPSFEQIRPLGVIALDQFELRFPPAEISPWAASETAPSA